MSKLEKIPYYSKLCDLFDIYRPKEIPERIQEVIRYINQSLQQYESKEGYCNDIRDKCELLKEIQRAFEEALLLDSSWGFYVQNSRQNISVNLRPIRTFLFDNETVVSDLEQLMDDMRNCLLSDGNVESYKKSISFIQCLRVTFDDHYVNKW